MTILETYELLRVNTDLSKGNCKDLSGVIAAATTGHLTYCNPMTGWMYVFKWEFDKNLEIKKESYCG